MRILDGYVFKAYDMLLTFCKRQSTENLKDKLLSEFTIKYS